MTNKSPLTKIADDIYQLRLPLPFALNHVNVYLISGDNGWTIVDTGINTQAGRDTWQAAFEEIQLKPREIEKVVLTHTHPDHFGLAGWLQEIASDDGRDIPIILSPKEKSFTQAVWKNDDTEETFRQWLRASQMPDEMIDEVQGSMGNTRAMTFPHPTGFTTHTAGNNIRMGNRTFQTIHAPGHADGQLIFYDEDDKLMLSGDHVLMTITPNIGLWFHSDPNPLGLFLDSLKEVRDLDVQLALPGHRRLIEDWRGRIDELIHHHEARLKFCLEAIDSGKHTPYQVAEHIFPTERFTVHEWRFAMAETYAHLEHLRVDGKITQAAGQRHFSIA